MISGLVLTATEMEGCAPAADWSRWIADGRAPASGDGAGFVANTADDLIQLAALGASEIQLTLEWARLEPRQGHHDPEALEERLTQLRLARQSGFRVWGCLVDGTLPGWFADDEGGFGDDRARGLLWPRHIDWIGEQFGDLVDGWVPQREPAHWALRRWLVGAAPPGRHDAGATAAAVRDAILADGEAWRLLRGTAPVATFQTVRPVAPTVADVKATPRATAVRRLLTDAWVLAITEGVLDVDGLPQREVDHLRGAYDRVIVQLRAGITVDRHGRWSPDPATGRAGRTGMIAVPEMQIGALRAVAERIDTPIVAAGDLADVDDDGRSRPDHLRAMLDLVAEAVEDTGVVGWWQTSPIDGYRWEYGFSVQPGLIDRTRAESPAAETFRSRFS